MGYPGKRQNLAAAKYRTCTTSKDVAPVEVYIAWRSKGVLITFHFHSKIVQCLQASSLAAQPVKQTITAQHESVVEDHAAESDVSEAAERIALPQYDVCVTTSADRQRLIWILRSLPAEVRLPLALVSANGVSSRICLTNPVQKKTR